VVAMEPGTIAVGEGGEYAGGAPVSAGAGRLVGLVVGKEFEDAMSLVDELENDASFVRPNDGVRDDAGLRLALDSLLEPNFLNNEDILVDGECVVETRVIVAMMSFGQ